MHPSIRGNNLMTIYVSSEGSYVIPNKVSYLHDDTWMKVVKVVAPGIRKIKVRNLTFVLPILFFIYLTLHICHSKFSTDDMCPAWW